MDAGHRGLPATSAIQIGLLGLIHTSNSSLFRVQSDGLLSLLLVVGVRIDVQPLQGFLADGVLGQHAPDSHLHGQLGLLLHQDAVGGLLQAADPAGVGPVHLLGALLAGQHSLAGVDDDDIVTAVGVGGEGGLGLAAQQVGSPDGGLAQGLARGVQDVPLTLNVGLVCHKSGHGVSSVY